MRSFSEFQRHIHLHRQRVVQLGLTLAKYHFRGLRPNDLESFLNLHDHSKTLTNPQILNWFNYKNPRSPAERLFEFYGRSPKTFQETLRLNEVIQEINSIDEKVSLHFFMENTQLSWGTQDDFFVIEKVADLVDRSLDPMAAEEFGHKMVLASDYVRDPYLSHLSMWLESRYHEITKDLIFSNHP